MLSEPGPGQAWFWLGGVAERSIPLAPGKPRSDRAFPTGRDSIRLRAGSRFARNDKQGPVACSFPLFAKEWGRRGHVPKNVPRGTICIMFHVEHYL